MSLSMSKLALNMMSYKNCFSILKKYFAKKLMEINRVSPILKRVYLGRYKSVLLVLYIHGYVLVCSNIFWKARLLRVTSKVSFCPMKNVQQQTFFRKILFVNNLAKIITSSL